MAGMVIIGAGECGVRAAFALREKGYEGAITLIGEEPSLPYERPPLSKTLNSELKEIRPAQAYSDAGIELRLDVQISHIDPSAKTVGSEAIPYDKLLLATGASARQFSNIAECLTLRNDKDAREIAKHVKPGNRIGIIGGGFIGLELAATARRAGAEVSVLEAAPRLLGRAVPRAIAAIIQDRHESEGVRIELGRQVQGADQSSISLDDGTRLEFDIVIAGVGAVPNTELAEKAGLSVDNGITVDGDFRTSEPDIFAAGDCCNFSWRGTRLRLESWRAAQDQGEHAAAAMLGETAAYTKVPWFWSDQYDMTLQVAGLFDSRLATRERAVPDGQAIVFQCDSAGHLSAAAGIGPGNAIAKDLRILEKLIERQATVDADTLADGSQNLKRLLKSA